MHWIITRCATGRKAISKSFDRSEWLRTRRISAVRQSQPGNFSKPTPGYIEQRFCIVLASNSTFLIGNLGRNQQRAKLSNQDYHLCLHFDLQDKQPRL
ncbi:hypothetical protein KM043_018003 [Ampulex compressa]|nr:hypothetical protein KM043_018003 [Ampulex compressa]